jgi:hypothetical protein
MIIASLAVGEDIVDVVDWLLHLVDVPGFVLFHQQCYADDLSGCRNA